MNRWVVVIMLLSASALAVAQTTQSSVPGAIAGPSTNTGTAVIIAPPSAPLLVTPEVHLTTVVPQVGASNATPGNTAGAANSTAAIPAPPRVIDTVPQFAGTASTVTMTLPPQETSGTNNTRLFDRGVGSGTSLGTSDTIGGKSLGEQARENRQRETGANARVYTNQDIDRINQQSGTQVGGVAGAAVGAGNASGAQPQTPSGNLPVVAEPSTNPASNPGVSQPVPSSSAPRDQSEAIPSSPLGQMPAAERQPTQMAQANPPANPAEQNAQAANEQRGGRQLPSAASILPIVALVGILAAGAGLLAR